MKMCGYEKDNLNKITWKELTFVSFAGLIRGAIAFGLVLRLDANLINRGVIVTTCLTLVVFTTIFFGSIIGLLSKCLFGDLSTSEEDAEDDDLASVSNYSNNSKIAIILEKKKAAL
jgi:NhaP-type Na+/H+ or K+/H+ antiporter